MSRSLADGTRRRATRREPPPAISILASEARSKAHGGRAHSFPLRVSRRTLLSIALTSLGCCLLMIRSARAEVEASIARFVDEVEVALRAIHEGAREGCGAFVDWAFDAPAMAKAAAGDSRQLMTNVQFSNFERAFSARLVGGCLKRSEDYADGRLTIVGVRVTGETRIVGVKVVRPGGDEPITVWRLRPGGAKGWRAIDIASEGSSFVEAEREAYAAFLDAHGNDVDALLAWMRR